MSMRRACNRRVLSAPVRGFATRVPVIKHKVSPRLSVPAEIKRPVYALPGGQVPDMGENVTINTADTIARIREACSLASRMRAYAGTLVKPGVTTDAIDKLVHAEIIRNGAYPSPLGYAGFPKSICTSLNEVAVHGIPDARPLAEGDIVKIDVSLYKNGVHGDCCGSFLVGEVDAAGKKLVDVTYEAVQKAVALCGPGVPLSAIGDCISELAGRHGYSVVSRFGGHGLGENLHMFPFIFHHKNNAPGFMQPGMVFTIEPMLTEGTAELDVWSDGWTAVTLDGGRSAQVEEAVVITDVGADVLTR